MFDKQIFKTIGGLNMFNKTIYIVLISVFILIFSLTCVSAAQDNITTDDLVVDENINIKSSVEDEGILGDSNNGTFADLNNLIQNTSVDSEIKLEKDYYYDNNIDSDFEHGIYIYNSLTIDGQGHKIDAKNNTIFQIGESYYELKVTLINITFLNGKNVVRFSNGDLNIFNSNFINCNNHHYAITFGGSGDLNIINSSFINDNGGIYFGGSDLNIINSSFINNSANEGGAIHLMSVYEHDDYYSPSNYNIINSVFINNSAYKGGAIYLKPNHKLDDEDDYYYFPSKCNIINSNFINNHAKIYYCSYFGKTIEFNNCTFKDNYVESKLKIGVLNYPSRKTTSIVNAEYGEDCIVLIGLSDSNNKQFSFIVNHKRIVNDFEFKHKIVINDAKKFKLKSKSVKFKINGEIQGYTLLKINGLTPKTYRATITYYDIYNNIVATKTIKIVVKKATPKITAKKLTFKAKKKSKKYTITLKSGQNPVKKVKVHLKIGKKTFKATTNSKGKAVFKIKLNKKGNYNSKITFKGNKCYKSSSKTVKIKIK